MPRLIDLPACRAAYQTNPEQSNPLGLDPPHTYGEPRNFNPAPAIPSIGAPAGRAATAMGFGAGAAGLGGAGFPAGAGAAVGFGAAAAAGAGAAAGALGPAA